MGDLQQSVGDWLSGFLIRFIGSRLPWLTGDPELLAMIAGFITGALSAWFLYWLIHKGKINGFTATIKGLEAEIAGLVREQHILERQKAELENKLKEQQTHSSLSPSIFSIEQQDAFLKWRTDEGGNQMYPIHPNIVTPTNAVFVLEIQAHVTAIPSLLLQNIELEIMGERLPEEDWQSRMVSQHFFHFYFVIPKHIPLGLHPSQLVATFSRNGSEIAEQKFRLPSIRLARSYEELKK